MPQSCDSGWSHARERQANGAEPVMGGYFDVAIEGRAVDVQFHAPGPVKRAPLKSAGFEGDVYAPHGRAFPVKLALA